MSRYAYTALREHPLQPSKKWKNVPMHRCVLFEKIGPGTHQCHWCGRRVVWRPGARTAIGALVVDHLDGVSQNNDPANLVPSCHRCNASRGRRNLVRDDELYIYMPGNR